MKKFHQMLQKKLLKKQVQKNKKLGQPIEVGLFEFEIILHLPNIENLSQYDIIIIQRNFFYKLGQRKSKLGVKPWQD